MNYKEAWHLLTLWLEERADKYKQSVRICTNAGLLDVAMRDDIMVLALLGVIDTMDRMERKIEEAHHETNTR